LGNTPSTFNAERRTAELRSKKPITDN